MAKSSKNGGLFFRVVVAVPIHRVFDYKAPDNVNRNSLQPGIRLLVPFGNTKKIGFLLEVCDDSAIDSAALKQVQSIIDDKPLLTGVDMEILAWISGYYHYPLGEVISSAFPLLLRKGKALAPANISRYQLTALGKSLALDRLGRAASQKQLLEKLQANKQAVSAELLRDWNKNWRGPVKALIDKGYLEKLEVAMEAGEQRLLAQSFRSPLQANTEQQQAINEIGDNLDEFRVFLLEGITGSGKTEVYMQVISRVIGQGRQVLVLLPEISLTPQLEQRFNERFSVAVAVSHSGLSNSQRAAAWSRVQRGQAPILLGTRSALLTPMLNPGLIVVDEEHDTSFKQQEGLRFSARDVAVVRAKKLNIPIVLGSATPSLESLFNVQSGRYRLLQLSRRAGVAKEPVLKILDIRNRSLTEGLSEPLLDEIRRTLARREQVLIFLNRRGFAPALMCHACGWIARCRRCDANMVVHQHESVLRCHHCSYQQNLFKQCPACKTMELLPLGLGTERVEQSLRQLFPEETMVRLDRDTTRNKGTLEKLLKEINSGHTRIILGTQMLAKGHHFPNVTLVGILDVDSGLYSTDFHAPEKLAQMIMQVSGRAGRAEKPGQVILQTRQPEHPLLNTLVGQGYRQFALKALQERREACLPPHSYQAIFRVLAIEKQAAVDFLEQLSALTGAKPANGVDVFGPVPAPMARRAGRYRFQLLLQAKKRRQLHDLLDSIIPEIERLKASRKVRWSLDVDPVDLY